MDCILWSGAKSGDGYGTVTINNRQLSAHRAAWEQKHGPIPSGLWVLHKCDKPLCVNPDHLFLGTAKENTQDCIKKGRRNTPKGEAHANRKLDQSAALDIRNSAGKEQQKVTAKRHGVSITTVSLIQARKAWAHLP